ncbi:hypothetical protein [Nonomuraea insulae]|uniref:Uncharacterized protein n=1 Tax=Nonomuraea insulae TaxID=1616787 RepID=A0ABW1DCY5_9ACTN
MYKFTRIGTLMLVAVAGLVLAAPMPPASAAISPAGIEYDIDFRQATPGQPRIEAFPPCGATQVTVGSGVAGNGVTISELAPSIGIDTFFSALGHVGFPNATLQAVVACLPQAQLGSTTRVTTQFPPTSAVLHKGTVTCPAGFYSFGGGGYFVDAGGFRTSNTDFMTVNAPTPDGRGWAYAARNNSVTDRLVVTARCAQSASPRRDMLVQASTPSVNGQLVTANAICPSGWTAISGGIALIKADGTPSLGFADISMPITNFINPAVGYTVHGRATDLGTSTVARAQCVR